MRLNALDANASGADKSAPSRRKERNPVILATNNDGTNLTPAPRKSNVAISAVRYCVLLTSEKSERTSAPGVLMVLPLRSTVPNASVESAPAGKAVSPQ